MNKKIAVITGAVGTVLTAVLTVKHIKNTSYADGYKAGAVTAWNMLKLL